MKWTQSIYLLLFVSTFAGQAFAQDRWTYDEWAVVAGEEDSPARAKIREIHRTPPRSYGNSEYYYVVETASSAEAQSDVVVVYSKEGEMIDGCLVPKVYQQLFECADEWIYLTFSENKRAVQFTSGKKVQDSSSFASKLE